MNAKLVRRGALLLPALLTACTVWIRHPEYYAEQVVALVDAQGDAIAVCYDRVLETEPEAQGQVVVSFAVIKKSGRFERIEVEADTTAPPALTKCVLDSLGTLRLEPPDRADGLLTLVWRFKLGKPKAEVSASNPETEAEAEKAAEEGVPEGETEGEAETGAPESPPGASPPPSPG